MDKRGQIYLLVALILALVLYMLMTKTNVIYEHEIIDDFETLSRNYDIEASKFMNILLSKSGEPDVKTDFNQFTCEFTKYAKNQNPDFSLIYIFEYKEEIYIGNHLIQPIIIGEETVLESCRGGAGYSGGGEGFGTGGSLDVCNEGCIEKIPTTGSLELTIGCTLYEITITSGRPEVVIVSREEKGEQRKVYAKEFVGGGGKGKPAKAVCKEHHEKNSNVCATGCNYYKFKEMCECDDYCCWDGENCKGMGRCEE